ncbi:NUDIX hydrolase [Teredinibacter sp. KSP-S5-2]|uniref:NUDIX hydrolase n=1 Tax=Teredinibacter sp. KSP-S5-2 TaxID=3034506 RepID=UPI0029346C37|nr:NUDIX domain-containing protein [Teredinibacter sp. KSP-S5-2]WNO10859.1 NUDIX domain-containing protein [Teredinibacter sp. KSP-S5-2]
MNKIDWVLYSVDPVIFTFHKGELCVLLVKRSSEPEKGLWALPGGRVDKDNCPDLDSALLAKLKRKTGIENIFFEQLSTYGSDSMDPRGWSVTTAYLALAHEGEFDINNMEGSEIIRWKPISDVGTKCEMAFWHEQIIKDAFNRLRDKSLYTDLPVNFMPETFTYPMLKEAYEKILGISITRQSFAKRMDSAGIFEDTGEREAGRNRPSPLYRKINRGGAYIFPGIIKGVAPSNG